MIKEVKNTITWSYVIEDYNGGEFLRMFHKKELQKTNQTEFIVGKVIKRKGDKLYVNWKGHDN